MSTLQQLLVITPLYYGPFREIVRGLRSAIGTHGQWTVQLAMLDFNPEQLGATRMDAVILIDSDVSVRKVIKHIGVPVISLFNVYDDLTAASIVRLDDEAVGGMAAQYFMDRGFTHFAYAGDKGTMWSRRRRDGFVSSLKRNGRTCDHINDGIFDSARGRTSLDESVHWMVALPKPVAIFCGNDIAGRAVLDDCRTLNLKVPTEVAVLGVDDDDLTCQLAVPTLSSVALPYRRMGMEAAVAVHRLLAGGKAEEVIINPVGVVSRLSTDVFAVADEDVKMALRFVYDHGHTISGPADVLRHVPVSRRCLERKFRSSIGQTIMGQIHAARIRVAKQLLSQSDMPIAEISKRSGFANATRLSIALRKATGKAPLQYRREFRMDDHKSGSPD